MYLVRYETAPAGSRSSGPIRAGWRNELARATRIRLSERSSG